MLNYQFNNEPVRLFLASLASGLSQTDQVINTSFQKFVLREMRTHANAVEGKALWIAAKRRFMSGHSSAGKADAEEIEDDNESGDDGAELTKETDGGESARPKRSNPVLPTLYGQSLILAKSYQGALCALLSFLPWIVGLKLYFVQQSIFCTPTTILQMTPSFV